MASNLRTLFDEGFAYPKLTDWLDWVSVGEGEQFVALPMLQRNAVWKPQQIITLWDSLLRGMPVGSLMLTELKPHSEVLVRRVGSREAIPLPPTGGAALVDGQQRTLAMLLGWQRTQGSAMGGRTIWVDFADQPAPNHLFRMHVTSSVYPYGYTRSDPNSRLALRDRHEAMAAMGWSHRRELTADDQMPWDSRFPVRLTDLLTLFKQSPASWERDVHDLLRRAKPHRGCNWASFEDGASRGEHDPVAAIARFERRLHALAEMRIPLIAIPDHCFEDPDANDGDDPQLAVLFKRVGASGTALSDADYVFSVIKYHEPRTYELVDNLSRLGGLAQLLGPLDIVMTAVRLVAAELGLSDYESPTMREFDRLRMPPKDGAPAFMPAFMRLIESNDLSHALSGLWQCLAYRGGNDVGLPALALTLISRPVLQVLLRWMLMRKLVASRSPEQIQHSLEPSRQEMLRFVLYAHVATHNDRLASVWAYEWLVHAEANQTDLEIFPGKQLVHDWLDAVQHENRQVAYRLPTKEQMACLSHTVVSDSSCPMRGWTRFQEAEGLRSNDMAFFESWWGRPRGYRHPILLWIQRGYVHTIACGSDDQEWSLEETVYDYDHICPSDEWSNWSKSGRGTRLLDFQSPSDSYGHTILGNAIGNVRIWDARENRGYGNMPASSKLKLADRMDAQGILRDSAIAAVEQHLNDWCQSSADGMHRTWSADRAAAFQRVIEQRTSGLYCRYFDDLQFEAWFPSSTA